MRLLAPLILALVATGCASGGQPRPDPSPLPELSNTTMRGEIAWDADGGVGAGDRVTGFQLAVDGRNVYTANRDGVVTALKLDNGDEVWRKDTGLRLMSGPSVAEGMLLVGTRDGKVVALSAEDGSERWRAQVSGEVLSAPAIGNGSVVVRTLDGQLIAFDLDGGERRWTVSRNVPTLTLRGTSSPVILGDTVVAGLDNGEVLALDLSNGEQEWQQRVAVPSGRSELERVVDIDAALLPVESRIYAASAGGQVASLSQSSGRVHWKREVAVRTGLTFDPNQVFATDMDGGVWSFDRSSGAALWHQEALAYRELSAPVMYRGYVTVADLEGYLHWMVPEDGSVIGRVYAVDAPVRATPVVVGEHILVLGTDGTVAAVKGVRPESE